MIHPAEVAGLALPFAFGLLDRLAKFGVLPEPALDRLWRDHHKLGSTAAGLAGAELFEKEHHDLGQALAGASRAACAWRVGGQGAEVGGFDMGLHIGLTTPWKRMSELCRASDERQLPRPAS